MAHQLTWSCSAIVLSMVFGCASKNPEPPRVAVIAPPSARSSGGVSAPPQTNPEGKALPPAATVDGVTSPTGETSTSVPSPFHFVAFGSVVAADDRLYLYDGDQLLAEVEGTTVTNQPEYLGSYPMGQFESVHFAGGKWPNQAYLAVNRPAQRSGYTVMMKKVGKTWKEITRTAVAEWIQAVKPWDRGRHVALVSAMYGYYRWEVVEGAPRTVPTPTLAGANGCCGPRSTAQMPVDFTALPSGDLFTVGALVEEPSTWVVEHFAPKVKQGMMVRLPAPTGEGVDIEVTGIYASTAEDVYVFGQIRKLRADSKYQRDTVGGYLAHFDGKSWVIVALPSTGAVTSVATEGQALWVVAGGSVFRRAAPEQPFETVKLPAVTEPVKAAFTSIKKSEGDAWTLSASDVLVRENHDVWLTANLSIGTMKSGSVVLRNRAHEALWKGLGARDYAQTMEQYQALRPADEYCQSIYVLLYGVSRSTPKNYDYPLTRNAIKGHSEFAEVVFAETEELGQHYFGAFVPDIELSRKLVKLISNQVPGTKPVALCRNPKKVRLVKIDLKTGNVLENTPLVDPPAAP